MAADGATCNRSRVTPRVFNFAEFVTAWLDLRRVNERHVRLGFFVGVLFAHVRRRRLLVLGGFLARPARLERATYGFEVRCSIQLSYGRALGWMMGLEPTTPGTTIRCSTVELHPPQAVRGISRSISILNPTPLFLTGTPGGIRTPDIRLRRPALYPTELLAPNSVVGARGFEPPTSCSQSRRANQTAPRPEGTSYYRKT